MTDDLRIAVLAPLLGDAVRHLIPEATVLTVADAGSVEGACSGAHIVLADYSGEHVITAELAELLAPTCRLIQAASAGLDGVDVEACGRAGIPVAACVGLNDDAVAEWCVWAIIDGLRALSASAAALGSGSWEQLGPTRLRLAGRTVGIVGIGAIGTALARRLAGFDVTVQYWSRTRRSPSIEDDLGVAWRELDDLLGEADVVVLLCALTDQTRNLIDERRLGLMKPTAVLVNAARGAVVDEQALARALAQGHLHAAVLDVFTDEPLPPDNPLVGSSRTILTPHVAGVTSESVQAVFARAMENIVAAAHGRPVEGIVASPAT